MTLIGGFAYVVGHWIFGLTIWRAAAVAMIISIILLVLEARAKSEK